MTGPRRRPETLTRRHGWALDMVGALLELAEPLKSPCRERFILRRSRLHSGLSQVFLLLFALATVAPAFRAPITGTESEDSVSALADPQGDAAALVGATLSVAEDLEEDADQEEATFLVLARLPCASDADDRATDAWLPPFPRPSAQSCTGPPAL